MPLRGSAIATLTPYCGRLQSLANNNHPQHCKNLAAARCKHFGAGDHTEAATGKHAMPAQIAKLKIFFWRG